MSFLEQLGSSLKDIGDFAQKAQPIYNQWEQNNQMAHLYDLARARPELYGNRRKFYNHLAVVAIIKQLYHNWQVLTQINMDQWHYSNQTH